MFLVWCLVPRILGAGFRAYEPTALKVPHPHAVPEVGSLSMYFGLS